ncbi:helix-turn-helix domain-containing protein [Streptomyces sp. NPDC051940]|uniref:ArsR/SmtB family transcription factor n=1 Tax=Streptomyces sp. NPDC051940 TaxID=3155675 RepID=UPI00341FFBBE
MLRVYFTAEDLTRVRVAPGADVLWEISNSFQTLQRSDGTREFGEWRRWVRPRLSDSCLLLSPLLPPRGYSPDFLTPTRGDCGTLQAAVDTLLRTPAARLRTDLARAAAVRRLPRWTGPLARGDNEALLRLGRAVRTYHREALEPFWHRISAQIDADRMVRLNTLLEGGTEALLSGLGAHIRWRPPVLEAPYPVDHTIHLGGRGVTLQPSFFCWPTPFTLADPELPPVLGYPIRRDSDWLRPATAGRSGGALGRLLGHTRAAVLRASLTGCSTVELARLLGVTHPAVSQHIGVLRDAGLVSTVRLEGRSLHVATAAGRALLRGAEPPVPDLDVPGRI